MYIYLYNRKARKCYYLVRYQLIIDLYIEVHIGFRYLIKMVHSGS